MHGFDGIFFVIIFVVEKINFIIQKTIFYSKTHTKSASEKLSLQNSFTVYYSLPFYVWYLNKESSAYQRDESIFNIILFAQPWYKSSAKF